MRRRNYGAILDALLDPPGPDEPQEEPEPTPDRSGVAPEELEDADP